MRTFSGFDEAKKLALKKRALARPPALPISSRPVVREPAHRVDALKHAKCISHTVSNVDRAAKVNLTLHEPRQIDYYVGDFNPSRAAGVCNAPPAILSGRFIIPANKVNIPVALR